jgi:hypothetical protein
MQYTQFRAKSKKNDLKPADFLKRNFYFETEGVSFKQARGGGPLTSPLPNVAVTISAFCQMAM